MQEVKKVNIEEYITEKICPICNQIVGESDYLNQLFKDEPKANYLAHLVTHYRHNHITSWNKCWGYNGAYYRANWFKDYGLEKMKVNERASDNHPQGEKNIKGIRCLDKRFRLLANTDDKTIALSEKLLQ